MDIAVVLDMQDGVPKLVRGNLYRFELQVGGLRVYGFRYDPKNGNILVPESEDKHRGKHKVAGISPELEDEIRRLLKGDNSKKEEVSHQKEDEYSGIDEQTRKHLEETKKLREEHFKNNPKKDKIQ